VSAAHVSGTLTAIDFGNFFVEQGINGSANDKRAWHKSAVQNLVISIWPLFG